MKFQANKMQNSKGAGFQLCVLRCQLYSIYAYHKNRKKNIDIIMENLKYFSVSTVMYK